MKGTKIKDYASLALALALVLPATSHASALDGADSKLITDEEITEKIDSKDQELSTNLAMNLDESGKIANYTINIEKTNINEDLQAIFYISDGSNLENLQVLASQSIAATDIKTVDSNLAKKIIVNLKDADTIKIKADIKEGKTSNLSFDYIIAGKNESYITSQRIVSSIENGKLSGQNINGLGSIIAGKFTKENTIQWSDFLVNPSNKDVTTNYDINLSQNQTNPSKINIEIFKASKDGFVSEIQEELDFGQIKNLTIPANGSAKISFSTDADPTDQAFTLNGVEAKKNQEKVNENANEVQSLTKEINENDQKIKVEMKKLDKGLAKDGKEDNTEEKQVSKLTKEIEDRNEEILAQMREIDKNLDTKENKQAKKVETVNLDEENSDKDEKQSAANNQIKVEEVRSLIKELDDRTLEIQDLMRQIDKENLAWYKQNKSNYQNNEGQTVASLIKELDDRNIAIKNELEKIYGKYAVDTVMQLSKNMDQETYELIVGLDKNNEKIQEIIDQVSSSIKENKDLDQDENLVIIKDLLDNVENLESSNEKALEKLVEDKENQELNQSLENLMMDKRRESKDDLEKVATVTLDPLSSPNNSEVNKSLTKDYSTIAKYLEGLNLYKDLLK